MMNQFFIKVENTEVKNEILESGKSRTMIGKLSAESPAGLGSPAQAKSKSAQLLLKQLQEMYEGKKKNIYFFFLNRAFL